MIIHGYDNYQEVNFELRFGKELGDDLYYDEINMKNRYSKSEGTGGSIDCFWHSPDIEDYEPKRWSDLNFNPEDNGSKNQNNTN